MRPRASSVFLAGSCIVSLFAIVTLDLGSRASAAPAASLTPAPAPAKPDIQIVLSAPKEALKPGNRGETSLLLSPPLGIKINRYPPVVLKLQAPDGIALDASEVRQGSDEPIENPDDFPFKKLEPMKVGFSVSPTAKPGKARVSGTIKFVYCVASSGYCAPTTKDVGFDVTVAPDRTN